MADSKHTVGDLRQLQALPLRLKIPLTRQRIRDWYEHWDGQVYVSFFRRQGQHSAEAHR